MNNKDFYNLFAKTDLIDMTPPDFSLPQHKRKSFVRKSMKKIMAYEKSNFRIAEKMINVKRRSIMIFASIVLISLMLMSAGIMTILYFWNPERGIVDKNGNKIDADIEYTVFTSDTAVKFGDAVLSYVILTEYGKSSTLSVWIIDDSNRPVSEKLIKDLYAVTENGKYPLYSNGYDSANGYNYICDSFPKNENVTIQSETLGISTEISLKEKEINEIFVPEINGYSFTISLSEDRNKFNLIIIDRNILTSEMSDYIYLRLMFDSNWTFWDAKGIEYSIGKSDLDVDEYGRAFLSLSVNGIEADKIVKIDIPCLLFKYVFNTDNKFGYGIPLPADGETLYGDWQAFNMDGLRDRVDSITRDGDRLIIHQPSIALEYNGNIPIFDPEGLPEILLYDENGKKIDKMLNWDFEYEFNNNGVVTSDCGRTMIVQFAEGTLDNTARIELSERSLTIYISGNWSVEIK